MRWIWMEMAWMNECWKTYMSPPTSCIHFWPKSRGQRYLGYPVTEFIPAHPIRLGLMQVRRCGWDQVRACPPLQYLNCLRTWSCLSHFYLIRFFRMLGGRWNCSSFPTTCCTCTTRFVIIIISTLRRRRRRTLTKWYLPLLFPPLLIFVDVKELVSRQWNSQYLTPNVVREGCGFQFLEGWSVFGTSSTHSRNTRAA